MIALLSVMKAPRAPGRAALVTIAIAGTKRPDTNTKKSVVSTSTPNSGSTGACVIASSGSSEIHAMRR